MSRVTDKNVFIRDDIDDVCSICLDDNTAVILRGSDNASCNICSNEIVLCQFCYSEIVAKADELLGRK